VTALLCAVCAAYGIITRASTRELSVEHRADGSIARVLPELDVCDACAEVARSYPLASEVRHACSVCTHVLGDGEEVCPVHPDAMIVSLLVGPEVRGDADRDELPPDVAADLDRRVDARVIELELLTAAEVGERAERSGCLRAVRHSIARHEVANAMQVEAFEADVVASLATIVDAYTTTGDLLAFTALAQRGAASEAMVDALLALAVVLRAEVDADGMLRRGDKSSDAIAAAEQHVRDVAAREASSRGGSR
jgi:hypothetical protein